MGWAEQRDNGRWRGVYRDRQQCKLHTRETYPNEAAAKRAANAKEDAVRNRPAHRARVVKRAEAYTVNQWLDEHCAARVANGTVAPGTAGRDVSRFETHVRPYWGDWRLHEITRDDVQDWVNALTVTRALNGQREGQRLRPATVKRIYLNFSSLMRAAITGAPKLPYTPCVEISLPTIEPPDERFLTTEEVAKLRAAAPNATARMFVDLAVNTGMRFGEMIGLHRKRIHLDAPTPFVEIRDACDMFVCDISLTKNRERRSVPLSGDLVAKLRAFMAKQPAHACATPHRSGDTCDSALLFERDGKAWLDYTFRNLEWRPMLAGADIGAVRIHDLRHTYASWLIQRGRSLDEICDLLGHSSVLVTRRYAHLGKTHWGAVVAALDETPQPPTPTEPESAPENSAPNLPPIEDQHARAKIIKFPHRSSSAS